MNRAYFLPAMTERKALIVAFDNSDKNFFWLHPDRLAHIRLPYADECAGEFWSLGDHQRTRRRILLCRCDAGRNRLPDNKILKIPFLAFSDETIEDRDDLLLPIVDEIMENAAKGLKR